MRTIIIGGVAGGMSAATRLRRLDESAEIVVFERGPYVSFANCGLPYYVGGVIPERSSLLLQTPQSLASRFRLDVRVEHEVISIDPHARTVTVRDLTANTESELGYDTLVLAVGANARQATPEHGAIPTHTLRTIDDIDAITALLDKPEARGAALVIGGGFIGLEAAENLVARGLDTTLVQRGPQVLTPLDPEMAAPLAEHLRAHGVNVRTSTVITDVAGDTVTLSDGTMLTPDFIIDASGVTPNTALAREAGLRIGATGGIAVDSENRTSDPQIFAVGDGVEKQDALTGEPTLITMAGLANRHGRTVADVISGRDEHNTPALGTAIVGLFGMAAAKTGHGERELRAAGRQFRAIHTHPTSHAGYYPGAQGMSIKLLVDPTTDAILGAQIVGGEGVDKRIDVLAVAMSAGLTASQLTRLELAYAPQFGSAKDPINQLGYVAENLATGTTANVQWHELDAAMSAGDILIDVRSPAEFAGGAIAGAVNIPLDDLRERLNELSELGDSRVIVHCQVGQRGHTATRILAQNGFTAVNLDGGYRTWKAGVSASTPERINA